MTEKSQDDEVEKRLGPSRGPNPLPKCCKLGNNGLLPSHLAIHLPRFVEKLGA